MTQPDIIIATGEPCEICLEPGAVWVSDPETGESGWFCRDSAACRERVRGAVEGVDPCDGPILSGHSVPAELMPGGVRIADGEIPW